MLAVVLVALIGPLVAPNSPTAMISSPYAPAGPGLPFGADALGRDVFSRFLSGGISLLWMALSAATMAVALGTWIGMWAALKKGMSDEILMRIVDIKMAFPTTVFALMLVTMLGTNVFLLVAVVGISLTPGVARVIRGAALTVVDREYVLFSRVAGFSTSYILFREVLPNVTSSLLAEFGLRLMWGISSLAGLSFLGFGIQPPTADWGLMINESRNALAIQPWAVLLPVAGIAAFAIGGNIFAEGVAQGLRRKSENEQ